MNMLYGLAIILSLNMMFFFAQIAVVDVSGEITGVPTKFFSTDGNLIGQFDQGNYTLSDDPTSRIPADSNAVDTATDSNWLTDSWKTIKNALFEKTKLSYIVGMITAFPSFLTMMGMPAEIVFGLSFFWYVLTLTMIIMWMRG